MATRHLAPVHPGEVLLEEFLEPMAISQYRLAKDISVPPRRINEMVHGQRAVTADTALRLARYFGTSDRFWLILQTTYDLDVERDKLGAMAPLSAMSAASFVRACAKLPTGMAGSTGERGSRRVRYESS